jgi:hypothetical protein
MRQYNRGDTVYIKYRHETYDPATDTWSLANPDTDYPKITIIDSKGVAQLDGAAMNPVATGKFDKQYQSLSTADTGRWHGFVETCNGGYKDTTDFEFEVR